MTTRDELDAAVEAAAKFFSEKPWWLENMVNRVLGAAAEEKFRKAAENNRGVMEMMQRIYGDDFEASERSLADYVTRRQDWHIVAGNVRHFYPDFTREEIDAEVRRLERVHAVVYVEGDA